MMQKQFNILILGASYGSLLGSKLLLAGHRVSLVCRQETADLINREGTRVRLPLKAQGGQVEIDSRQLPGRLQALTPDQARPQEYDLVCLAMQEPQYSARGVRDLLRLVALAKVPCMSIMNMPPPPYLARLRGVDVNELRACFTEPNLWDDFEPALMTLCSPDPQAFRPPTEPANVLQVGLPTNFKAARFDNAQHNAMLHQLAADIEGARLLLDGTEVELPVKLKVHDSLYVPLAKWSMLMTGNYRCVETGSMRAIAAAVHTDIAKSRQVYAWVSSLCIRLGAGEEDMVAFEKYASAAQGLLKPSSAARALIAGANDIERIDLLIKLVAAQQGMQSDVVDETVNRVNGWLAHNRQQTISRAASVNIDPGADARNDAIVQALA